MGDRLLVRHFLGRFLEHDLISSNADRREVVSVIGGTVMAISLFLSVIITLDYQFSNFMPPGLVSVRSLNDRFLLVSASMLVMGLLAVAAWDALSLDARDHAVLGVLPISRTVIIRSKFVAVGVLAIGTDLAWNLAPTLLRSVAVPIKLSIGLKGALILTLAHGFVSLAAGAFGFLSVFALREVFSAVLGQDRFRSISPFLQGALVVVLTSALFLLPGSYGNVAHKWLAPNGSSAKALPPLWFVGLHETLAGSVIDRLPRVRPARPLVERERNATALYRGLWPVYRQLSRWALMAMAAVTIVTILASAWNSRRLPTAVDHPRRTLTTSPVWRWMVEHVVARSSLRQAGFWFTLQTVPRRVNHRAVMASALAVGFSLVVIALRGHALEVETNIASIPLSILAAQSLLIVSVVTGFRRAAQVPADLRASSTFSLAWAGHTQPYVAGVKRAALAALVLPMLAVLFFWHAALLGVRVAVLHFGLGVALSILLIETLFLCYRRMPFVSVYVPDSELKSRGVAYIAGMFYLSFALAWVERLALGATFGYWLFAGVIVGLTVVVSAFDQRWRRAPVVLDLDEESPLPTQRIDLSG